MSLIKPWNRFPWDITCPQLLGEFKSRLGWRCWLAQSKPHTTGESPGTRGWGLGALDWLSLGFWQALWTPPGSICCQFSFQCDDFCYGAKSVRLHGCWLPNPLAVLPGVFSGICVGLEINWGWPRLLRGSRARQLGPLCGSCSFWAGAGPIAPAFSLPWSNTKLPGIWPKQTDSPSPTAGMSLEKSCAPQIGYKPPC